MQIIINVLGKEAREDMEKLIQTDKLEVLDSSKEITDKQPLEVLFVNQNPVAIDLLKKMLIVDPDKRITVEEALSHPLMSEFHDPEDEPTTEKLNQYDFDFELYDLTSE